jgi:membrane-bound lytic murein transglycosylase MltF
MGYSNWLPGVKQRELHAQLPCREELRSQAYQESGLNQEAKSSVGAVGVMQIFFEMLNAGPIGMTVARDMYADFWAKIYPGIHPHKG